MNFFSADIQQNYNEIAYLYHKNMSLDHKRRNEPYRYGRWEPYQLREASVSPDRTKCNKYNTRNAAINLKKIFAGAIRSLYSFHKDTLFDEQWF